MKRALFPVVLKAATGCFGLGTLLLFWCNGFSAAGTLGALAITFLTFFCHLAMRLLVGSVIPNGFDYRSPWFQTKAWEQALYKKLCIKQWKKHIPTYDPKSFSLEDNSLEQIVANMCHAEVVHEVIVLCSFLPLLLSLVFGEFFVFLFTSLAAAAVDLVFVALQRSNRPRLVRLLEKQSQRSNP